MKNSAKFIVPLLTLLFVSISAFSQTPRALKNVVGDNANYLEDYMKVEGYNYINRSKSGSNEYQNWWSHSDKQCVTVRITNNKVKSVIETLPADCGKSNNNNNNYNHNKHNNNYNNYNNEYQHDSNYQYQNGEVKVYDLRNKSALSAYDELQDRGFRDVKKHTDGGTTYHIWYNNDTNQCIKTVSKDRKISSIFNSTSDACPNR